MVFSRFSYAKLGLSVELATSIIQSGYNGRIHFQIKNNTRNYIYIYPNISIAQLVFFRTLQPSTHKYREYKNVKNYDAAYENPPIPQFSRNLKVPQKKWGHLVNV